MVSTKRLLQRQQLKKGIIMDTITTILAKDVTAKRHTLVYAALRMMELSGLDHSVCLDRIENEQEVIAKNYRTKVNIEMQEELIAETDKINNLKWEKEYRMGASL